MKYRLYTISNGNNSNDIAIPEDRVDDFDAFLVNLPEGNQIEDLLNNFGAILIG